jgi:hypothetical protein
MEDASKINKQAKKEERERVKEERQKAREKKEEQKKLKQAYKSAFGKRLSVVDTYIKMQKMLKKKNKKLTSAQLEFSSKEAINVGVQTKSDLDTKLYIDNLKK